jgi:hypothetical protein
MTTSRLLPPSNTALPQNGPSSRAFDHHLLAKPRTRLVRHLPSLDLIQTVEDEFARPHDPPRSPSPGFQACAHRCVLTTSRCAYAASLQSTGTLRRFARWRRDRVPTAVTGKPKNRNLFLNSLPSRWARSSTPPSIPASHSSSCIPELGRDPPRMPKSPRSPGFGGGADCFPRIQILRRIHLGLAWTPKDG